MPHTSPRRPLEWTAAKIADIRLGDAVVLHRVPPRDILWADDTIDLQPTDVISNLYGLDPLDHEVAIRKAVRHPRREP